MGSALDTGHFLKKQKIDFDVLKKYPVFRADPFFVFALFILIMDKLVFLEALEKKG